MAKALLDQLMEALRCLPGVGPKSAQRMAFHLLERGREEGLHLSRVLADAMSLIGHCERCRTFSETKLCTLCASPHRNADQICVVETPAEVTALEQATNYRGRYFVLGGRLSPLDGIGPKEIGLDLLEKLLADETVEELILATNPTVEGDGTALHISNLLAELPIHVTRLARGITTGSVLEFANKEILADALTGRQEF